MTNPLSLNMLKATSLTRAGRLMDATEFLQRVLQGEPSALDASDQPASAVSGRLPSLLRGFLEKKHIGIQPEIVGSVGGPPVQAHDITSGRGQFLERSYSCSSCGRPYKLYVPSGYRGQAVPLIVMLHGCTQSPDDFAAGTRMNETAEEQTFLVVYPAQVASANASKCWNWFSRNDQQRGQGEPALIACITNEVMAEYHVNVREVYVAGLSAGGAAAAIMGATYPDLYAAVGVHSGLACGSASDLPSSFAAMRRGGMSSASHGMSLSKKRREQIGPNQHAVRTIVFHGDQDKTVHPRNGEEILTQLGARTADLRPDIESGQVSRGHSYSRTRLCDANGQAIFENWIIHGAGHAWSGGSSAGSYTDPRGPDATREMLRFFREQTPSLAY